MNIKLISRIGHIRPISWLRQQKTRRKAFILVLLFLFVLSSLGVWKFLSPKEAEAAWFDDSYGYRQKITFTNTSEISSERRVTVTINTATLITAGKMQSDCDDTRFTDANGKLLRYQLTGTCNNAATTYDVVFPSIINGANLGYVYYGNPAAVSASQNVSGVTALGASNGGPVKIDDASNFGAVAGGRNVVRTSSGTLYAFVVTTSTSCEIWKSTNGTSWSQQDSVNNPACTSNFMAIAIDSSNILHLAYLTNLSQQPTYITFNTSSDTFGLQETTAVLCTITCTGLDLAVDSNNVPHMIITDFDDGVPVATTVKYTDRIGGWDLGIVLESTTSPSYSSPGIVISEDNIPEIVYINGLDLDLTAAVGDANNPTTFTLQDVDINIFSNGNESSSIAVDSSGNTWIAYVDENGATDFVTLVKHNDADAWTTWQTPVTNSNAGDEPSIAIVGTDVYVFYDDELADVKYDRYNGSWLGETNLQTGTFQDVKAKWAFYNDNQQSSQIDYLYSDSIDVYWASLGFGPTVTVSTEEKGPQPQLYLKFDEGYGTTTQDQSSNNNDGSISGSSWQTEDLCLTEKCLRFDGVDDAVTVTNASSIDLNDQLAGTFTIQAWVRVNSDGEGDLGEIFDKDGGAVTPVTYLRVAAEGTDRLADLQASIDLATTDATLTITDGITLDRWHYLALTYTDDADDEITIYIDGRSRGSSTNGSGVPTTDTFSLLIGGSTSNNFHGFIDEFKVYKEERTAAQISTDFIKASSSLHGQSAGFGIKDYSYLSNGLVGYWKMDETGWTNDCVTEDATDSSGNLNHGESCPGTTGPDPTSGKFGNGGNFDNTDDYVLVDDANSLDVTTNFTLTAWVYPNEVTSDDHQIYSKDGVGSDTTDAYNLHLENSVSGKAYIVYETNNRGVVSTNVQHVSPTVWSHIAVTFDNSTSSKVKIFYNGTEVATDGANTQAPIALATNLLVGRRGDNATPRLFNGKLDELRIYNRTLSPSEVATLYNWAPSPIGHWKFDENTGVASNDSSGNGYNGTLTSGPTWIAGVYGSALSFDGGDDYVTTGSRVGPPNGFSVSAWINPTDTTGADIIASQYGSASDAYFQFFTNGSDVYGRIQQTKDSIYISRVATGVLQANIWQHYAFTWDGGTTTASIKVYKNGIRVDDANNSAGVFTAVNTASLPFDIGIQNATGGNKFTGKIDDVRAYNYARTQKQIVEDMNAGHPAPGSPVGSAAGYWKLDEGFGTTAQDANSLNNDLTLSTQSWTNNGKFNKAWNGTGAVWLTRADDDDFDFAAPDDFSISFWFKSDSATNPASVSEYLLEKGTITNTGTAGYAIYANTSGNIVFGIKDDAAWGASSPDTPAPDDTATSTTDIYDATWHHIVATKTGTTRIDLYVDGRLDASDTSLAATVTLANAIALRVGDDDADAANSFNGDLDEVKTYRLALTASEVRLEYNWASTAVWGTTSTTTGGAGDWSSRREYCPPGNTETNCAAGLDPSPVIELRFDENTGTTANDTSENERSGTLTSGAQFAIGKIGSGSEFDGTNDYVEILSPSLPTGDFSYTFWTYFDATSDETLLTAYGNAVAGLEEIRIDMNTSGADVRLDNADLIANYFSYATGTWYHTALTRSGSSVVIYVNGIQRASGTDGDALDFTGCTPLELGTDVDGCGVPSNTLDGKMDTLRVFNYALTQAQVAWDYNRGAPIAWYKLDECQGTTTNNSAPAASGGDSGADGTITIGATGTNTAAGTCDSGNTAHAWYNGRTGKFNASLDLDDTDDYISVSSPNLPTADFTYSAWVNIEADTSTDTVVMASDGVAGLDNNEIRILINDGGGAQTVQVYTNDVLRFTTTREVPDNTWTHLVLTRSGSSLSFYINARPDGTGSDGTALSFSTCPLLIGVDADDGCTGLLGNFLDGRIDNVRVYNYALTSKQVQTLYNEGSIFYGPNTGSP